MKINLKHFTDISIMLDHLKKNKFLVFLVLLALTNGKIFHYFQIEK